GVNTGVFQNTKTVNINSLQNGTITVTYADQKNASGVAQNITQTFTKTELTGNQVIGIYTGGLISKVEVTLKDGQNVTGVTVDGVPLATTDYKVTNNVLRLVNIAKTAKITFTVDGEATPYEVVIQ
ncbi:MAG: hypothetical protein IJW82_00935, partial [Clostridia bacterium]|nr:hypothetical protein [Clostridia bacterium]